MVMGRERNALTSQARTFLTRKGKFFDEGNFTYMTLYGYKGKHLYLLKFICDQFLLVGIGR